MTLLNWIRFAGWENVLYVDTDGLLVNREGYRCLRAAGQVYSDAPLSLRVDQAEVGCEILGVKWLWVGADRRAAGLPRSARPARRLVGGGVRHEAWIGRHVSLGQRPEATRERRLISAPTVYRHGNLLPDGRVEPFRVSWEG